MRPRGYLGTGHETIGSDILALYHALLMPTAVLGDRLAAHIAQLDPDGWYPVAELLDPLEHLASTLGPDALRKSGRKLFELSHAERARGTVKSARDIAYGFDRIYRTANRGQDIGGWRVLSFEPGVCELEKTTPHHCALEEGILRAAMQLVGVPVEITQPECLRAGADHCRFVITSMVTDQRWNGE